MVMSASANPASPHVVLTVDGGIIADLDVAASLPDNLQLVNFITDANPASGESAIFDNLSMSGGHVVGDEISDKNAVRGTGGLRIAFPHDIIFTSGPDAVPYSGFFWPPSTPIPPSQIYIPRGPDPLTGEPNFKRMQWQVTTADTPREIWLGETPGFSYGDPDVPGSPSSNC